jgi:hypothetical protein
MIQKWQIPKAKSKSFSNSTPPSSHSKCNPRALRPGELTQTILLFGDSDWCKPGFELRRVSAAF